MNLTIEEASEYSNIGENTLRDILKYRKDEAEHFTILIGAKQLIKRKEFEEWNSTIYVLK